MKKIIFFCMVIFITSCDKMLPKQNAVTNSALPSSSVTSTTPTATGTGTAVSTTGVSTTSSAASAIANSTDYTGSVLINQGAASTNSLHAFIDILTTNLNTSEVYVTQTDDHCNDGGQWQTFNKRLNIDLTRSNGLNYVYVKLRDKKGAMSNCFYSMIIHDESKTINSAIMPSYVYTINKIIEPLDLNISLDTNETIEKCVSVPAIPVGLSLNAKTCTISGTPTMATAKTLFNIVATTSTGRVSNINTYISVTPVPVVPAVVAPIPLSGHFLINQGAEVTNSNVVTINSFSPTATFMRITNESDCIGTNEWIPYEASHTWTLADHVITPKVYVTYKNATQQTNCIVGQISVDVKAPTPVSLVINSGSSYALKKDVVLSISAIDAVSMYVTQNSSCSDGGAWEDYAGSKNFSLVADDGPVTVYAKFKDSQGNISECIHGGIYLTTALPTIVSATNVRDDGGRNVTLTWTPVMGADLYNVYNSKSSNITVANSTLVTTTSNMTYKHYSAPTGVSYYIVEPVAGLHKGNASAKISVNKMFSTFTISADNVPANGDTSKTLNDNRLMTVTDSVMDLASNKMYVTGDTMKRLATVSKTGATNMVKQITGGAANFKDVLAGSFIASIDTVSGYIDLIPVDLTTTYATIDQFQIKSISYNAAAKVIAVAGYCHKTGDAADYYFIALINATTKATTLVTAGALNDMAGVTPGISDRWLNYPMFVEIENLESNYNIVLSTTQKGTLLDAGATPPVPENKAVFLKRYDSTLTKVWDAADNSTAIVQNPFDNVISVGLALDNSRNIYVLAQSDSVSPSFMGLTKKTKSDFIIVKFNKDKVLNTATPPVAVVTIMSKNVIGTEMANNDYLTLYKKADRFFINRESNQDYLYISGTSNQIFCTNDCTSVGSDANNDYIKRFVMKISASGLSTISLATSFISTHDKSDPKNAFAVGGLSADAAGNFYISGLFKDDILEFTYDTDTDTLTNLGYIVPQGARALFLAKFDKDFKKVWAKRARADIEETILTNPQFLYTPSALNQVDNLGNITTVVPSIQSVDGVTPGGYQDLIFMKYDATGVKK